MQAFLLLFGLLFHPGASVRLKTVGESPCYLNPYGALAQKKALCVSVRVRVRVWTRE